MCNNNIALYLFAAIINILKQQSVKHNMQITTAAAQTAIAQHANSNTITQSAIVTLLSAVTGTTFANATYVTQVKTAAAHKALNIQKVTIANVTLANNLKAFTSLYVNKVQRTSSNSAQAFVSTASYFTHTNCYSIVKHNSKNAHYLFAMFNSASSVYMLNNVVLTKQQVAQYLTASAASKLLADNSTVVNVKNNITHSAIVRTIALANIVSLTAAKQTVTV